MRRTFLLLTALYGAVRAQEESLIDGLLAPIPEGVQVCEGENDLAGVSDSYRSGARLFCMNGGTCKENAQAWAEFPCICPDGYTGPHCEFEREDVPECDLQCFNDGLCQVGYKTWQQIGMQFERPEYCVCPEGFFGYQCEIEGKQCGVYNCFNGGTCVKAQQDDGVYEEYCDCTTATNGELAYGGRFCQNPATSFCTQLPDQNGNQFCVNGGTCKGDSYLGCDCPDGFVGPICEFVQQEREHAECNLECHNNGFCRKGVKDISILEQYDIGNRHLQNVEDSYNEDFEYCVCPKGFVGLQCEYQMDVCPGESQVCLNGSTCDARRSNTGIHFECDCRTASTPTQRFAGKLCENPATEFCTLTGKVGHGATHGAFCTNGGECRDFVEQGERHPGCDCTDDHQGKHCEFDSDGENNNDSTSKSIDPFLLIVMSLAMCGLALVILGFVLYLRRKTRKFKDVPPYWAEYTDAAPAPTLDRIHQEIDWDLYDDIDLDGEEDFGEFVGAEQDEHSMSSMETSPASGSKDAAFIERRLQQLEDDLKSRNAASLMKRQGRELVVFQEPATALTNEEDDNPVV